MPDDIVLETINLLSEWLKNVDYSVNIEKSKEEIQIHLLTNRYRKLIIIQNNNFAEEKHLIKVVVQNNIDYIIYDKDLEMGFYLIDMNMYTNRLLFVHNNKEDYSIIDLQNGYIIKSKGENITPIQKWYPRELLFTIDNETFLNTIDRAFVLSFYNTQFKIINNLSKFYPKVKKNKFEELSLLQSELFAILKIKII